MSINTGPSIDFLFAFRRIEQMFFEAMRMLFIVGLQSCLFLMKSISNVFIGLPFVETIIDGKMNILSLLIINHKQTAIVHILRISFLFDRRVYFTCFPDSVTCETSRTTTTARKEEERNQLKYKTTSDCSSMTKRTRRKRK